MSVPYEPSKWRIVYGSAEGTEGFALSELCGRISQELCQNIACVSAANFVRECENQSIVLMGTLKNNPLLAPYSEGLSSEPESYLIRTVNEGDCRQVLVIAGADPSGVLYGVCDFISKYADMLDHGHNYRGVRYKPFSDALPEINDASTPDIKKRGIWTWGRCIYDYRGFFDNMARCKMNTAVIWNDIAPLNGAEVVRYAHMRGVKILWGFSWGWSTEKAIDLSSEDDLNEWRDRIVSDYEKIWAPLGGDGIYFQTATECDEKLINGKPLAWWAVNWVNGIAAAMYEKYPDLDIEFGLHATSVRDTTEYLSQIDPKMAITWEDGGSFPFAYHAWDIEDYDETLELTDKMLSLRGENEKAGFVFKGIKTLFWPEFMPAR
ncbi:MAG: hypothetical protein IKZ19_04125, partial [Clostridia bacterium]|nr:hypothetical protein [Clostridia bacterium]